MGRIGSERAAQAALDTFAYGAPFDSLDVTEVGRGRDRVAYLIDGWVYKVGPEAAANVADHANLSAARASGHAWAPQTRLFHALDDLGAAVPVLCMPYLVDDDSDMDGDTAAEFHLATGGHVDRQGGNYVVIEGRPYVVDGCMIRPRTEPGRTVNGRA